MKQWIAAGTLACLLSGCVQLTNYQSAVKTPPPPELVGNWQSQGPQSALRSSEAIASLIIGPEGDTLDCRQWQRVIAKPGKITQVRHQWVNVNSAMRVMSLEVEGGVLHYDGLVLRKVERPTVACQQALDKAQAQPVVEPAVSVDATAPENANVINP